MKKKVFVFFIINLLFLCCIHAEEETLKEEESFVPDKEELSDSLVIETIPFEEKKRLADLRKESKEEFLKEIEEKLVQQREYLNLLREDDPELFEEILAKARARRITRKIKSREQERVSNLIKNKKKLLNIEKISFSKEEILRRNKQTWLNDPLMMEDITEKESNLSSFFEEPSDTVSYDEEESGVDRE